MFGGFSDSAVVCLCVVYVAIWMAVSCAIIIFPKKDNMPAEALLLSDSCVVANDAKAEWRKVQ